MEYKVIDKRSGKVWATYPDAEEAYDVANELNAVEEDDYYDVELA